LHRYGRPFADQKLYDRCREADILVAAVGRPEMVRGDGIKPGLRVDVGINRIEDPELGRRENDMPKTRLVGDGAFEEAMEVASAITPVSGGVGPITSACPLQNTVAAAYCKKALVAQTRNHLKRGSP